MSEKLDAETVLVEASIRLASAISRFGIDVRKHVKDGLLYFDTVDCVPRGMTPETVVRLLDSNQDPVRQLFLLCYCDEPYIKAVVDGKYDDDDDDD